MPSVPTSDKVVDRCAALFVGGGGDCNLQLLVPANIKQTGRHSSFQLMHACAVRPGETKLQVTISEDEQAPLSLSTP